ncbi:hypothetical protein OIV19_11985 [Brucella sp. HL-2]|nr:hypothetical protein [Brucella sp. HL-2]MCV9908332.1 hypothetical protein [Brucella sp. HL-2]
MKKLIKLDSLKVDVHQEQEGEWIFVKTWPRLGDLPGLQFKVRSTNSPDYVTAKTAQQIKLSQKYGTETPPFKEVSEADGYLAADYLLLDWKGVNESYNPEHARELLSSPEGRNILNMVFWCAEQVGRRQVEFLDETVKN